MLIGRIKSSLGCGNNDNLSKFYEHLHAEILHHKEKRAAFTLQKLAFITALFGLAVFKLWSSDSNLPKTFNILVIIIPFVAISYDVYIYAEDYKVKRAGTFLRRHTCASNCISNCEKDWELYVQDKHREPLATFATMALTLLTTGMAYYVAINLSIIFEYRNIIFYFETIVPIGLYIFYRYYRSKL